MKDSAVHLKIIDSQASDNAVADIADTEVLEAILDVPGTDTRKLLGSVVTTFEDTVIGQLEALDQLKLPHQIILQTPMLARTIKTSAIAAGATGVANVAVDIESLVNSATQDVSREDLVALIEGCYAALHQYLSVVFEHYLVSR